MKRKRTLWARIAGSFAGFLVLLLGSATFAPQLLAFPYSADFGDTRVYSETPIPPEMGRVLARADALLAQSPLDQPEMPRTLFLTDGGWRWTLLALSSRGALALRRPFRDAIMFNTSDVARDRIGVDGARSLSGVIAHETTHILVARHLGELRALGLPTWKSEGYADYVAQESRLSDGDYQRLRASGAFHPAMVYYEGRRRVAEILGRNGNDVDALLSGS